VEAYELESTNVVRKYLGVVDLPVSLVLAKWTGALICININPLLSYRAMQAHHSQLFGIANSSFFSLGLPLLTLSDPSLEMSPFKEKDNDPKPLLFEH